jgi:hypothetical protein
MDRKWSLDAVICLVAAVMMQEDVEFGLWDNFGEGYLGAADTDESLS